MARYLISHGQTAFILHTVQRSPAVSFSVSVAFLSAATEGKNPACEPCRESQMPLKILNYVPDNAIQRIEITKKATLLTNQIIPLYFLCVTGSLCEHSRDYGGQTGEAQGQASSPYAKINDLQSLLFTDEHQQCL